MDIQLFLSEMYYSVELIDEILIDQGINPEDDNDWFIELTGTYITSYKIPKMRAPLITSE